MKPFTLFSRRANKCQVHSIEKTNFNWENYYWTTIYIHLYTFS